MVVADSNPDRLENCDIIRIRGNQVYMIIGAVHVVPFGCTERGSVEDGYLRLCAACQAIRRLPDDYFPPFINEVTCDSDKACLYFYDYRKLLHIINCRLLSPSGLRIVFYITYLYYML